MTVHRRQIQVKAEVRNVAVPKSKTLGKIFVYTVCWNEEKLLPFFIEHYSKFADKIIIYDNESTDLSTEIMSKYPKVQRREYSSDNQIRDDLYLKIKNHAWKELRGAADWVIVCDIDEFFYHPTPVEFLNRSKTRGFTIIKPQGYNMASLEFPSYDKPLTESVKTGLLFDPESKMCVFSPSDVKEINYTAGCHHAKPQGNVSILQDSGAKLLHYKFLGRDNFLERNIQYRKRLSDANIRRGWGAHYLQSAEAHESTFDGTLAQSTEVI
jgi:glycosyltransferase involved in cell wall biosynthesis